MGLPGCRGFLIGQNDILDNGSGFKGKLNGYDIGELHSDVNMSLRVDPKGKGMFVIFE